MKKKLDFGQEISYISDMSPIIAQKILKNEPAGTQLYYECRQVIGKHLDNVVAGKIREKNIGKFKRS